MKKWSLTVWVVVILAIIVVGARIFFGSRQISGNPEQARAEGNPDARVKIVEFVDFQCPACAWGLKYLKTFLASHPNDLYIQVRYFPLTSLHHHALISALYSECAARQGKFWPLDDLMISQQAQWAQLINPQPVFDAMARQVGMDMDRLNACLDSDDTIKVINDEKVMGQSLGITSTPTYFINGKMVVGTKDLQDELKKYFPDP
jgi:protein-disulfide isomerase